MKYVFDTNAFYYYLMARHNLQLPHLSINKQIDKEKFLQFINSNHGNFLLPAVSIWELTTRFRYDPQVVIESMHICETDKIQICTNNFFSISPAVLGGFANKKANKSLVEKYIKENYVPQRAKTESWFLANIIIYNAVLFIQLQIHNPEFLKNIIDKNSLDSFDITYLAQIITAMYPTLVALTKMTDAHLFRLLQKSNNLDKIIKKEFEVALYNGLYFVYTELKKMQLQTTDNSIIDCSQAFDDKIMQKIKTCYLSGKPIMPQLNKIVETSDINADHVLLTDIMQKRGFTELQMKYFQVFIKDWFINGRKMHKNDFNDFLFVGFINNNELAITFDNKVKDFLNLHNLECGSKFIKNNA